MKTNLGLKKDGVTAVNKLLTRLLADEFVLYMKTRNYHWNVAGPHFHALHLLFETQYDALAENIDAIAERIRSLGGHAIGTLGEMLANARLEEQAGKYPAAPKMITHLRDDHEALVRTLRADVKACADKFGDDGTSDFLTALMEQHEKTAWMLRAHLEGQS